MGGHQQHKQQTNMQYTDPFSDLEACLRQKQDRSRLKLVGKPSSKLLKTSYKMKSKREIADRADAVNRRLRKTILRTRTKMSTRNKLCMWHRRNHGGMSRYQAKVNALLYEFFKMVTDDWFRLSPKRFHDIDFNSHLNIRCLIDLEEHNPITVNQRNVDFIATLSRLTLSFKYKSHNELISFCRSIDADDYFVDPTESELEDEPLLLSHETYEEMFDKYYHTGPTRSGNGARLRLLMSGIEPNPGPSFFLNYYFLRFLLWLFSVGAAKLLAGTAHRLMLEYVPLWDEVYEPMADPVIRVEYNLTNCLAAAMTCSFLAIVMWLYATSVAVDVNKPDGLAINYDESIMSSNPPSSWDKLRAIVCDHEWFQIVNICVQDHMEDITELRADIGLNFNSARDYLASISTDHGTIFGSSLPVMTYTGPGFVLAIDETQAPPTPMIAVEERMPMAVSTLTMKRRFHCRKCRCFKAYELGDITTHDVNKNIIEDSLNLASASPSSVIISRINNRISRWVSGHVGINVELNTLSVRLGMELALTRSAYLNDTAQTLLLEHGFGHADTWYLETSKPTPRAQMSRYVVSIIMLLLGVLSVLLASYGSWMHIAI